MDFISIDHIQQRYSYPTVVVTTLRYHN